MTIPSVGMEPGAIPTSGTHVTQSPERRHRSLWLRELPFALVLILIVVGVAYTSFSKQPIITYWEVLAPIIGIVCIAAGWQNAEDRAAQWRLVWTQALHWLAFIFVMNMMLVPSVQRSFNAGTTALTIFLLLALGTFTAGVHVLSWQICLLGLIMAIGIPALAWIENSALLIVLVVAALLGIVATFWWYWRERRLRPNLR
jgi:hypothetical protein